MGRSDFNSELAVSTRHGFPVNYFDAPLPGNDPNNPDWQKVITRVRTGENAISEDPTVTEIEDAWFQFFYEILPHTTDAILSSSEARLDDPSKTAFNEDYYIGTFAKQYKNWKNNHATEVSFPQYLDDPTRSDMRYRQRNVLFWQLFKTLEIMKSAQQTAINRTRDPLKWSQAGEKALDKAASIEIPAIVNATPDADTPTKDPDSIQAQKDAQVAIERHRADFNTMRDRQRKGDSDRQFAVDSEKSARDSQDNFWATLQKILGRINN